MFNYVTADILNSHSNGYKTSKFILIHYFPDNGIGSNHAIRIIVIDF